MICEVLAAEVTQLCGPKHSPSEGEHYRAGSSPGRVLYEGEREEIIRPRVRRAVADGSSQEGVSTCLISHWAAVNALKSPVNRVTWFQDLRVV